MPRKTQQKQDEAQPAIHVRYVGNGRQYFIGVPARDLTREEFDGLNAIDRRDVLAGTIYEPASPEAEKQHEQQNPPPQEPAGDNNGSENN